MFSLLKIIDNCMAIVSFCTVELLASFNCLYFNSVELIEQSEF